MTVHISRKHLRKGIWPFDNCNIVLTELVCLKKLRGLKICHYHKKWSSTNVHFKSEYQESFNKSILKLTRGYNFANIATVLLQPIKVWSRIPYLLVRKENVSIISSTSSISDGRRLVLFFVFRSQCLNMDSAYDQTNWKWLINRVKCHLFCFHKDCNILHIGIHYSIQLHP